MKFSEFPYYKPDINEVKKNFEELFQKFTDSKSFEEQDKVFRNIDKLGVEFDTMANIAKVRYSTNTTDKTFEEDNEYFDYISPVFWGIEA